ncbi:MAG: hypothetical protein J5617_04075 [Bacilli bacterium]|nr:hypothetical protein [Bacilli bacterium]
MPDKTYAKFILNNETYLDLTGDTVDSSSLLSGYTAHDRSGAAITGSFDSSIFVLKAGDTMSGSLTIANIEAEQLFEINSKNGLRLALDLSSLCNQGIWSSGFSNSLTANGAYIADSSWIIVRDSSNRVKIPKWASRGSSASPVYFDANGQPQQSSYSFSNYLLKTGGTMSGDLTISRTTASSGSSSLCTLTLGNDISISQAGSSTGVIRLYGLGTSYADIRNSSSNSSPIMLSLPSSGGTLALTSDLTSYVAKSGSTMTGALTLSGNPTENLHAVPKQYVIGNFVSKNGEEYLYNHFVITDATPLDTGTVNVDLSKDGIYVSDNDIDLQGYYREIHITREILNIKKDYTDTNSNTWSTYLNLDYNKLTIYDEDEGGSLLNGINKSELDSNSLKFYNSNNIISKISNTELQINGVNLLTHLNLYTPDIGATLIPANADLNAETYQRVGTYYCVGNATLQTLTNAPAGMIQSNTQSIKMTVTSPGFSDGAIDGTSPFAYVRTFETDAGRFSVQKLKRSAESGSLSLSHWSNVVMSPAIDSNVNATQETVNKTTTLTKVASVTVPNTGVNFNMLYGLAIDAVEVIIALGTNYQIARAERSSSFGSDTRLMCFGALNQSNSRTYDLWARWSTSTGTATVTIGCFRINSFITN